MTLVLQTFRSSGAHFVDAFPFYKHSAPLEVNFVVCVRFLTVVQFEFAGVLFAAPFRVFCGPGSCEDHGSHGIQGPPGIRKMALTTNPKSRGITGDS